MAFCHVFDWFEGEVKRDGTLVLRGQVVSPALKSDAEKIVSVVAGIKRVVNEIEVLAPSPNDEQLRLAVYGAVYKLDSPLFRYATRAVPPIHIIVRNGGATRLPSSSCRTASDGERSYSPPQMRRAPPSGEASARYSGGAPSSPR